MMKSLGHEVYHYGVGCDEECDEDIVIMDAVPMDWTGKAVWWPTFNKRVADSINLRKQPRDFVCVINGILNQSLSAIDNVILVEQAIGYNGTFAKYRVFASEAHRHKIWGAEGSYDPDGKWYDCVIPHYLDPKDFPLQTKKSDYYLYIGRLTHRKGIQIAVDTVKQIGGKLKIAGVGERLYKGEHIEYVGQVSGKQRLELYQNAIATFCATQYIEPFNMVAIESQACGTPVIATNFGGFTETIEHGKTGFRCNTQNEFVWAAKNVGALDSQYIHDRAVRLYSLDNVRWQYETYFKRLMDLWESGWYAIHDQVDVHWLKEY